MGEAVIGMAVSTAGSISGGMAGEALFGSPPVPGPDTSVPGVSSATMEKGGKGKPDKKIAQVDITQSLEWFQQAAAEQNASYMQGLNFFQNTMVAAAGIVKQQYALSNATLKPMADGSVAAFNEQMRFLGLDPVSKSASYGDRAGAIGLTPAIRKQMAEAEKIKDPLMRQQVRNQIITDIGSYAKTKDADIAKLVAKQDAIKNLPTSYGNPFDKASQEGGGQISIEQAKAAAAAGFNIPTSGMDAASANALGSFTGDPNVATGLTSMVALNGSQVKEFNKYLEKQKAEIAKRPQQIAELDAQINGVKAMQQGINDFGTNFGLDYQDKYDAGYTGEEVAQKLQATPGYQFTMDQGTQAVERQGASKGMLGSGNTLTALTKFGQDLGMQYFNQHMNQLASVAQQGSGAVTQLSNNQVGEGNALAGLLQTTGEVTNKAYQGMGDNTANSLYQQGKLFSDAAMFNVKAQNDYLQKDKEAKEDAAAKAAAAIAKGGM